MSSQRAGLTNLTKPRLAKAAPAIPVEEAAKRILLTDDFLSASYQDATEVVPPVQGVSATIPGPEWKDAEALGTVPVREHLIQKMFRLPLSVVQELEQFKDTKRYGTMTDIVLRGLRPELDRIRALETERSKHK